MKTGVVRRYYQEAGEYPPNLEDFVPHYPPIILVPLTGRGQIQEGSWACDAEIIRFKVTGGL